MSPRFAVPLLAVAALAALAGSARAADPPPPLVEKYLTEGKLAEGEQVLTAHLEKHPDDAQARFGLGALQFFRAVEHLYQGLYRYGLGSRFDNLVLVGNIPFMRLPVEPNPNPEPVSAAKLDKVFRAFLDDLGKARKTLEQVPDGPVRLPLHLFAVRLDLNGDGKATADEGLARVMQRMLGPQIPATVAHGGTVVCFDAADVHWLRGYCHMLAAMTEVILAYDWTEVIESCGHLFFARVEGPHGFLTEGQKVFDYQGTDIADVIALIHLLRMPVRDKAGMGRALEHLEAMVAQSRATWKLILAETDDDREWIPGPHQKSALTGLRVTKEMVDGWMAFLDEAEALLKGKKLIPFWRDRGDVGVNLRRVFTEPQALDVVLWVQGTATTPYLEKGEFTRKETWDRLQRTFRGDFIGFAIWFN
jgi:hypothetical protein